MIVIGKWTKIFFMGNVVMLHSMVSVVDQYCWPRAPIAVDHCAGLLHFVVLKLPVFSLKVLCIA